MSTVTRRRPLPALAFLLALTVLTGIVWWRVLHRPDNTVTASKAPGSTAPVRCTPGAKAVRLPTPASVTVQVLNGAGRDLLATKVTGQLKSRGFTVGTPGTTAALTGVAEIRYGRAGRSGATLLSYYLTGAKMVPASRKDAKIDLVLGTGFRSLAAPATVSRAVALANKPC
jgi:LytR cell envelope-related transcriptional attenuator